MTRHIVGSIVVVAFVLLLASLGLADPVIIAGDHTLQPNQPDQKIFISVSGGDLVGGVNFYARIDDGQAPTPSPAPLLTDLDVIGNATDPTIFFDNNNGQQNPEPPSGDPPPRNYPYFEVRTLTTAAGTEAADGLLAILTVDTTGVSGGTWDLILSDPADFQTYFTGTPPIFPTITNGTVEIEGGGPLVPEPSTLLLLLVGLCLVCCRRRSGGRR